MIILAKMTADYVKHEDRIALIGDAGDNGIVRLWLTRPLTQELAASLSDLLKQQSGEERHPEVLEAFKQASAERQHEPLPEVRYETPVEAPQSGRSSPAAALRVEKRNEWLVREIGAKLYSEGVTLAFRGAGDNQVARCGLSEELLRQWLGILRKVCLAAGWIGPDWPSWMSAPMALEGTGPMN